jgi:hypothetical protein
MPTRTPTRTIPTATVTARRRGAPGYDPPGPGYYQGLYVRPAGAPPYTTYRYRVAPSAKIIHLHPSE